MILNDKFTRDCYKSLKDLSNFNKGEREPHAFKDQTNELKLYWNYVRAEKKNREKKQTLQDTTVGETKGGSPAEPGDAATQGK
jgi:hypothetical protein